MRKRTRALLGSNLTAILNHEYTVVYPKEELFEPSFFFGGVITGIPLWLKKTRSSNLSFLPDVTKM